ncbi:hypothetical protein [Aliivibrio sp. SR45-2]|uniref:hypothetical protein n=1 Tax=Aliivibrio sp. SR45-2 TaxID=2760931 RepID=UPI0015F7C6EF|nr:hypothetical protein [Aliivibrio sp. SR45-2]MBB1314803.1 hypothetical protein [Aliivibrio sp. SR45-2]
MFYVGINRNFSGIDMYRLGAKNGVPWCVFVLPTYSTSLGAIEFDSTGSTLIGKK